jgi:hypothetical protein
MALTSVLWKSLFVLVSCVTGVFCAFRETSCTEYARWEIEMYRQMYPDRGGERKRKRKKKEKKEKKKERKKSSL